MLYFFKSNERQQIAEQFAHYAASHVIWPASYNDLYASFRQKFNLGSDQGQGVYADVAYRFYGIFKKYLKYQVIVYQEGVNKQIKAQMDANSRFFVLSQDWLKRLDDLTLHS